MNENRLASLIADLLDTVRAMHETILGPREFYPEHSALYKEGQTREDENQTCTTCGLINEAEYTVAVLLGGGEQ